ncbi:hypothetical protein BDZ89DRAFT_1080517 [Hymenopellis radicata]|nr:hypothetical protein BDZ89DRAFT_1080517 [Hymenopellis radicata]
MSTYAFLPSSETSRPEEHRNTASLLHALLTPDEVAFTKILSAQTDLMDLASATNHGDLRPVLDDLWTRKPQVMVLCQPILQLYPKARDARREIPTEDLINFLQRLVMWGNLTRGEHDIDMQADFNDALTAIFRDSSLLILRICIGISCDSSIQARRKTTLNGIRDIFNQLDRSLNTLCCPNDPPPPLAFIEAVRMGHPFSPYKDDVASQFAVVNAFALNYIRLIPPDSDHRPRFMEAQRRLSLEVVTMKEVWSTRIQTEPNRSYEALRLAYYWCYIIVLRRLKWGRPIVLADEEREMYQSQISALYAWHKRSERDVMRQNQRSFDSVRNCST